MAPRHVAEPVDTDLIKEVASNYAHRDLMEYHGLPRDDVWTDAANNALDVRRLAAQINENEH